MHHKFVIFPFTAKRKPPPLEVVYNISKKINSKAIPLKAFWLGNHHLLCRWSFTAIVGQEMMKKALLINAIDPYIETRLSDFDRDTEIKKDLLNLEEDITFLSTSANSINLVAVNAEIRNKSIGILENIAKSFNAPHFYLEELV